MTAEGRRQYGRYVDQLQDLRKSFDFMQDYADEQPWGE